MKSFYHYLAESVKTFKYRIKVAMPIDDAFMDIVKSVLFKYDLKNISEPKKLAMQLDPLDFVGLRMADIYILDIETAVPASPYVLATSLREALQITDKLLVVRGSNEPRELEAEQLENIHREAAEEEEEAKNALLQNDTYPESAQPKEIAFGDDYNKKLLNYLSQIEANGRTIENPQIDKIKKDNLFKWSTPKESNVADDFNAEFDTPKPVNSYAKKPGTKVEDPNLTTAYGNYDDSIKRKS